ncbi:hypothetical protein STEG23_037312, partial [Scotinomys teguina]
MFCTYLVPSSTNQNLRNQGESGSGIGTGAGMSSTIFYLQQPEGIFPEISTQMEQRFLTLCHKRISVQANTKQSWNFLEIQSLSLKFELKERNVENSWKTPCMDGRGAHKTPTLTGNFDGCWQEENHFSIVGVAT